MSKIEHVEQILSSILILENKTNPVLPLLLSSKNISNLIIYLNDQNKSLEEKLELLSTLLGYFQYNEYLINVFMRPIYYNSELYTLIFPIINIYLFPNIKEEQISLVVKLIKVILSHISINKTIVEYVYQKISLYFTNKEQKEILDEKMFMKYLNLLNILYTENTIPNEISIEKEVKNYMYFNGKNSALYFKLSISPYK